MPNSRRDFCRLTVLAATSVPLAACAGAPKGTATLEGEEIIVMLGDNPELAAAGAAVSVTVGEHKLIVVNAGEEGYLAASRTCTHMGCSVGWDAEGGEYECPCHGSRFSKTGEVTNGPAKKPISAYAVKDEAGRLRIAVA